MGNNKNLHAANRAKKDEFYTQLTDIEKELAHYKEHFRNKVVFCNCDDPEWSNFWVYFSQNFETLGLKRLVSTHYEKGKPSYKLELIHDVDGDGKVNGQDTVRTPLSGDGDFRSPECVEILKEADIVVTNPPFSLFREYVAQLVQFDKKFLVIGNINALTYKEIFPLIKAGKLWFGASIHSGDREFGVPDDYPLVAASSRVDAVGKKYVRIKGVRWFTNLDYPQRHEDLILYKHYTPEEYPKYDNYDAINIDKTKDIPCDFDGAMGVPITFMDKYNPEQFEILNANDYRVSPETPVKKHGLIKDKEATISAYAERVCSNNLCANTYPSHRRAVTDGILTGNVNTRGFSYEDMVASPAVASRKTYRRIFIRRK